MNRVVRNVFVLLPLLVTGLLAGACKNTPQQNAATGDPVEVTVVTLKAQPVSLVAELPGRTAAFTTSSAPATARPRSIHITAL